MQQPLKQIGGHHNRRELLCISVKLQCKYNANNVSTTVVLSLTQSAITVEQDKRSSFTKLRCKDKNRNTSMATSRDASDIKYGPEKKTYFFFSN
jgi:hypothetical protein